MTDDDSFTDSDSEDVALDPRVTPELYLEWRAPRFGKANPERMNNPVWEWLIASRVSAYEATELLDGPSAIEAGPGWCFDRFGQSETTLPDGRVVLIGGEHEDHYDPDFHIYNDVVVMRPDGHAEIFGYPVDVFPPTDFHSATLVGDRIVVVGSLSYPEDRRPGTTPVYVLDLNTFSIQPMPTSGVAPGWIHRHEADLVEDGAALVVRHGLVDRGVSDEPLVENIDDWRLDLTNGVWTRLTDRQWPRWEVRRVDGESHHLFQIQMTSWMQQMPELGDADEAGGLEEGPSLEKQLGSTLDPEVFASLYRPEVPHEVVEDTGEDLQIHRILVNGVGVRYVDNMRTLQILIEGDLPQDTADALVSDLKRKLALLENVECEARRL